LPFVGADRAFPGLAFTDAGGVAEPGLPWLFPWFPFLASATPETIANRPAIMIVVASDAFMLSRAFEVRRALFRGASKTVSPLIHCADSCCS
jgi:hypothetical protein